MPDESTEIFDDLYLGLRAGGALRKQRRGEPLTTEDHEALGRWARLSSWRKAVAIGAAIDRHGGTRTIDYRTVVVTALRV